MEELNQVKLSKVIDEFKLETIYLPDLPENIFVTCTRVNRPGLQMVGFYDHYEQARLQIIGKVEYFYLQTLSEKERAARLEDFFKSRPVGVIYSTAIMIDEQTVELVEVYGEGILLLGDSGVGKSETAIELLKRGHRLIADDAVEIRKVSATTLVGRAPEIIKHYVELRGIGIVDVRRLFGMGSVKETEKIDLVINLEPWQDGKMYDRLGLDESTTEILGIDVPSIVLPVCPGRNLSVVIEVAAMNNRQKRMGYNTAAEFNKRLMESMGLE